MPLVTESVKGIPAYPSPYPIFQRSFAGRIVGLYASGDGVAVGAAFAVGVGSGGFVGVAVGGGAFVGVGVAAGLQPATSKATTATTTSKLAVFLIVCSSFSVWLFYLPTSSVLRTNCIGASNALSLFLQTHHLLS